MKCENEVLKTAGLAPGDIAIAKKRLALDKAIYGEVAKADGLPAPDGVSIHVQETKKPQDGNTRDFNVKKEESEEEGGSFRRFVAAPLLFGCDYAVVVWNDCTFAISPPCHIDEKTPVQNVKVVIPEGKTIRLHFVNPDGNGAQGLAFEMDYTTPWGTGFVSGMTGIGREHLPASDKYMVTDAKGWLVIPHFNTDCPGKYRLICRSFTTYVPLDVALDPRQTEQEIQVTKGKVITGIAKDATTGKPIAGMWVYALYADCDHPKSDRSWNEWFDAEARTDKEGRFRFSNLTEDDFTLHSRNNNCDDIEVPVTTRGGQNEPVILNLKSHQKYPANQIQEAARAGDLEKVKALIQANPSLVLNTDDSLHATPLLAAAEKNRKEVVEFLLANKADIDARDVFGRTALHHAAQEGGFKESYKDLAALLIAHHADVNARDNGGLTPLHHAAQMGRKDVAELLLDNHADINARGKESGPTPLHVAVRCGRKDIVEVLLAHKADLNATGKDGLTPLRLAETLNQKEIADLLDPATAPTPPPTPAAPVDAAAVTEVITRLVTNASKKPPGPVEKDVSSGALDTIAGFRAMAKDKTPLRESIAAGFNNFTLEGGLTSLYSEGPAAIFYGKAKLTDDALANYKEESDGGVGFIDGSSSVAGSKIKNAHVIATFCLIQEHGLWKVACLYFSNDIIEGHNKDFIVEQLSDLAKKSQEPEIPSGYAILHHFGDGTVPSDGHNPRGSLLQRPGDECFYGVTQDKENSNSGTIYRITPQGKETVLHVFDGPLPRDDGPSYQSPNDPLEFGFRGDCWGTTKGGGQYNGGTFFEITNHGSFKILYEFGNPSIKDGPRAPAAPLRMGTDWVAYGTSELGGIAGHGTIFKMTAKGVVTTLHSFGDGSVPNDGYSPRTILMTDSDHNCYGTTSSGPKESDKPESKGTLFKITPNGELTILHRLGDGTVPNDGNASGQVGFYTGSIADTFYGTTEFGGASNNGGTFFKFTAKGGFAVLHAFGDHNTKEGVWPQPTLIQGPDGDFYGTTAGGGSANEGTIYKITTKGVVTVLHNFGDGTIPNDGIKPGGGLVLSDECFYGTTTEGGSAGNGVVFRIKVP